MPLPPSFLPTKSSFVPGRASTHAHACGALPLSFPFYSAMRKERGPLLLSPSWTAWAERKSATQAGACSLSMRAQRLASEGEGRRKKGSGGRAMRKWLDCTSPSRSAALAVFLPPSQAAVLSWTESKRASERLLSPLPSVDPVVVLVPRAGAAADHFMALSSACASLQLPRAPGNR